MISVMGLAVKGSHLLYRQTRSTHLPCPPTISIAGAVPCFLQSMQQSFGKQYNLPRHHLAGNVYLNNTRRQETWQQRNSVDLLALASTFTMPAGRLARCWPPILRSAPAADYQLSCQPHSLDGGVHRAGPLWRGRPGPLLGGLVAQTGGWRE